MGELPEATRSLLDSMSRSGFKVVFGTTVGGWPVVTGRDMTTHRFAGSCEDKVLAILAKCPEWAAGNKGLPIDWEELFLLGRRIPRLEELQACMAQLMDMNLSIERHAAVRARISVLMEELAP